MSTKKTHGVQRVLEKLEASVNAGNFYEAHQMYRTIYFRYLMQKKYSELLNILYHGAELLLKNNERTSGADLSSLIVDVLVKSREPTSDEHFEKLTRLFDMIGADVPERESFLERALQWSIADSTEYKSGHPHFHRNIAKVFWKEKNYVLARYHFLRSTDGSGCAMMLVELHTLKGYPSEVDLFITQAVLQYLCLRNKATAAAVFKCYTIQHPHIKEGPPYLLPLLNFIWFLLQAIESGKLAIFTVLCERYQPSLQRDPSYMSYLEKIAQIFFNLPPARPKSQGLFGDLLHSFLCELDDSDSDEESRQTSSQNKTPSHNQKMEMEELD